MAKRGGGLRTQAPKQVTVVISGILWLIGLLDGLAVFALPNRLGFGALVVAGLLLLLGSLMNGL